METLDVRPVQARRLQIRAIDVGTFEGGTPDVGVLEIRIAPLRVLGIAIGQVRGAADGALNASCCCRRPKSYQPTARLSA